MQKGTETIKVVWPNVVQYPNLLEIPSFILWPIPLKFECYANTNWSVHLHVYIQPGVSVK